MRINCEYQDHLNERCREDGFAVQVGFRSEREDWIQMMVAAGSASVLSRSFGRLSPASSLASLPTPEVVRQVSLVSITGRRFSPGVAAFARAIRGYRWPEAKETLA